ncbi:hypothetical protein [Zobellia sp. B3R18]|uniref:hypothetical protein n=1 Tax=Zobellia sp. B3R18 TaxID=2841568 RepID=UPI001C067793|nr:hypothetical protein [Zobellia sp. B3R18]MBU2974989.1 hypothetical protein [Zobellia sp. B3R18]
MKGFVKIPREILDWEWYTHSTASRLYIHLILKANYSDKYWQGNKVNRGQLITSNKHLAAELHMSIQQIRTALQKLISSSYITCKSTNKFSLITVVDYKSMQANINEHNKQSITLPTCKQQTFNNPITTTKENKELYKSKEEFRSAVFANSQYSNKILNAFFNYWSETDKSGKAMRVNDQTYFEIKSRLEKWKKNERDSLKTDNRLLTNR